MSITSKIVLSALLVGITVPAFAQGGLVGGTVAVSKPAITSHSAVHKVASPVEAPKAGPAVATGTTTTTGATTSTGVAASTKPQAKPELGKTDAMKPDVTKPQVNTGITKPASPTVSGTTTVAPKIN